LNCLVVEGLGSLPLEGKVARDSETDEVFLKIKFITFAIGFPISQIGRYITMRKKSKDIGNNLMNTIRNSKLTNISKMLRRNMTKEEKRLWYDFFRKLPQTVNRQKVIGKYIVDFYCASANLVIEIDGSQHSKKTNLCKDYERDLYLNNLGIAVLRYSNLDVNLHFEDVCIDILHHIEIKN